MPAVLTAAVSAFAVLDFVVGTASSRPEWTCLAMAAVDATKRARDSPIVRRILIRMRLHVIGTVAPAGGPARHAVSG